MPYIAILLLLVQLLFGIHVIKTGRNIFWLWIILLIPGLGCLLYFLTQMLPDMTQSHQAKRAGKTLIKTLDPGREIRQLQDELEISDSIDNRMALADAYIKAGRPEEAIPLYERSLRGIHENDPDIMFKMAEACFISEDYNKAKELLGKIVADKPDNLTHDGHLLYAKTLEALQLTNEAIREYDQISESYPGEEARVRYGLLLKKTGNEDRARELFKETLTRIKRAPKFYLKKEKHWIEVASDNLE